MPHAGKRMVMCGAASALSGVQILKRGTAEDGTQVHKKLLITSFQQALFEELLFLGIPIIILSTLQKLKEGQKEEENHQQQQTDNSRGEKK